MKTRKASFFFWYLLALAVLLLAYFYLAFPKLSSAAAQRNAEHENNLRLIRIYSDARANLSRLQSENSGLETQIAAAREHTPAPEDIAGDLDKALAAEGLRAQQISVSDSAPVSGSGARKSSSGGTLSSVGITLELQCTPQQLERLLTGFDGKRGYYVSSLEWQENSSGGAIGVSLGLSLYYYAGGSSAR